MSNVIKFPTKTNRNTSGLSGRARALEHFNSSGLWYFIDIKDWNMEFSTAKNIALFVPKGERLPYGLSEHDFGHVYYEEAL